MDLYVRSADSRPRSASLLRACSTRVLALLATAVFGSVWIAGSARADDPEALARPSAPGTEFPRGCTRREREALAFLEERLEGNASYARWWWRISNGIYVAGMAFEGTRAGLADDRGERAKLIASAVKSTIGLARGLLAPPAAMEGAHGLGTSGRDAAGCSEVLEAAESRLREAAKQTEHERWSWWPHLVNLALNAGGAIVVAEGYDEDSAYVDGAIGLAGGEIRLWTYPWQAVDDLEEYERRFGEDRRARRPTTTWRIEPLALGLRLRVQF